jgi:hypothetical protein
VEDLVNENYREIKRRIHKLDDLLTARGMGNIAFVRALDTVRRASKREDSRRDPSPELRLLLEKAEELGRTLAG